MYSHERDEGWNVTSYLSSLQHSLTPREIYWRYWWVTNLDGARKFPADDS